ncbi:MAG: hypothetical protein E7Y34_02615, partial [Mycoplasma sp.]|nr:hypothetical protein [Mycoplasma sp.]
KELNKKYGLKLAEKRDYPKITNKKYNKILLFLLESLNLEYIKTYNENLKAQNSNRFFNSTKVIKNTFTNYYSAVRGTAWGILATLTSEPSFYIYNYLQKNENQKIENAIPFILQKNGFTNYYIAFSDIKYQKFDSMLSSLGFHYTFGSQHFIKNDAEVAEFSKIAKPEWAAAMPDILLYKKIYEFIKEKKDEKYFLTSLNIDTHVPGRREKDYYGLDKDIPDFKISNKYNEYGKY